MDASVGTNTRIYLRASHAFIAVLELLIGSIAQANTNLLNNGSFEVPSVPPGKLTNFRSGSSAIDGWTVVGSETSIVSGKFRSFLVQFPASDGSQWLDLTGYLSTSWGGVEQAVSTSPGKAYLLSFALGNVFDPHGLYGTTSTVDVTVNGMALGTFTNSCNTCTKTLGWQTFSISFVAGTPITVIRFSSADPPMDNSNGLDNVALRERPEAPVR